MGVDVAAAGSRVGSVVVIGEGDAWRPEALGAPLKVGSFLGSCPWSRSRFTRCWHCWCLRRRLHVGVLFLGVHIRSPFLLIYDCSRRTGCTARGCCRYAETVCLLLPEGFIGISTLSVCCASPAACCCCRVSCCLFLMRKMFYLLKNNQSRITQARDKQVEENQDQSMKGCSHKELDKENYQQ